MSSQFASGVPTGRRDASRAPQPARPPGRLRDTAPHRFTPGALILLGLLLLAFRKAVA
jgi:hypothetical protein